MTASRIRELSLRLRDGTVTARDLAAAAVTAATTGNDAIGAFVMVEEATVAAAARRADEELAAGLDRGPLHGVPVAVKDIIDVAGWPTRCGSPTYPNTPVAGDAAVVRRLRDAGAVIIGKTTAHELACGVSSPPARNPWNVERVPGGSSGGSGAAVAAGVVPMALGSDTGGSIRIPAAVCGVVGIKPTFGRVSRAGVEPLSWSLDHLGPLAATVEDCAITLGVLAGRDPADPATLDEPVPEYTSHLGRGVDGLRVGVLRGEPFAPMQPGVSAAFGAAVACLEELGATPVEVTVAELGYAIAAEFAVIAPEAGHYHRRRLRDHAASIDPAIRALLVSGLLLPAAQYVRGLQARKAIAAALRRSFVEHALDVMVTPTLPATAAGVEQEELAYEDRVEPVTISYVRTTAPFNLAGLPALSVPCGFDGAGLPVGLQVVGRPLEEHVVFQVAGAYEEATPWHEMRPPLHVEASP